MLIHMAVWIVALLSSRESGREKDPNFESVDLPQILNDADALIRLITSLLSISPIVFPIMA
jgi:hypothetical protein